VTSNALQTLPADNDTWIQDNWEFDDKELHDYLMSSQLGPFSSMCKKFLYVFVQFAHV
jgi:hypothetical protein